jgi:hypothetical protein
MSNPKENVMRNALFASTAAMAAVLFGAAAPGR